MPPATAPGIPGRRSTNLSTFTIRIEGEPIPGTVGVFSLDTTRELNRIPTLSLVLHDGDPAAQEFPLSAGDLFVPGHRIEVEGGYGGDETPLFAGVITGQRIKAGRKGDSLLHVEARGAAFRMTLDHRSRYFREISDADLFSEITDTYPDLRAEVDGGSRVHEEIVQHRVSDWDLVVSRAERLGMICLPLDDRLRFAPPDLSAEPVISVAYGMGVIELDLEMDARSQPGSVIASAWNSSEQALIRADAPEEAMPPQGDLAGPRLAESAGTGDRHVQSAGRIGPEVLDEWAAARLQRARLARIRGTVRVLGTGAVRPADLVELRGLGARFDGTAFVSGVRHSISRGEWETTIQLGLDQRGHLEIHTLAPPQAAGLGPPLHGLQIGVVTQLEEDPRGEDRVRVRLPLVSADEMGAWARLATFTAGPDRGAVFRPDVGDEVVVGFLDDDPNDGVVLGALHGGAHRAPLPAVDENPQKGIVTREGLRLVFDDEARSVAVETPGGRRIRLDDDAGCIVLEDDQGNSIRMDGNGIAFESPGEISLEAATEVNVEAATIGLAGQSLEAEGSASASFRSGGTTEVKGALVRIN